MNTDPAPSDGAWLALAFGISMFGLFVIALGVSAVTEWIGRRRRR